MTIENLIQKEIFKILSEEDKSKKDEKEKKKTVKAKPGRGRVKTYIKKAKARAASDPVGLMKRLIKVSTHTFQQAPSFEEKIERLIRAALTGTPEMQAAFRGIRLENTGAYVAMEALDVRDGVMFINHILIAAQSSGLIKLEKDLEVIPSGDKVQIKFVQAG